MSWPIVAGIVGSQILGSLLKGGDESSAESTTQYVSTPIKVRLPSGAVVTLYQNKEVGETKTQETGGDDFSDVLGNAVTSAGNAYAFGEMYDKGKETTLDPEDKYDDSWT